MAELRQDLEQARRDARSSPFASEFVSLREVTSVKDQEIRAIRSALARRDAQIGVVKSKLSDFARKLLEAQKDQERSRESIDDLESEVAASKAKWNLVSGDLEEQERRNTREIEALRASLAEEQVRHTVARRERESEMSNLRAAHARTLQSKAAEHETSLAEFEAKLRAQKTEISEESKSKYSEKVDEIQDSREREIATLK